MSINDVPPSLIYREPFPAVEMTDSEVCLSCPTQPVPWLVLHSILTETIMKNVIWNGNSFTVIAHRDTLQRIPGLRKALTLCCVLSALKAARPAAV